MKNITIRFLLLAAASLILFSCSTISYMPTVSLDIADKTIYKSIQIDKFVDVSDPYDRNNPFLGLSVTNEEAMPNDLALNVTNAVVSDFSTNSVFSNASRRVENPDYVMKGEIKKYKGISKLTNYGYVSFITIIGIYTWFLGMPVEKIETEIEIEVSIYDNQENFIATYTGKATGFRRTSMYRSIALATPSQTNRDFSLAIEDIRKQIAADIDKYE